ncbi:MAG: proline dehydrogenase, partial [Bacteroidetes bacterium HGW-Bacteroidetes-15]
MLSFNNTEVAFAWRNHKDLKRAKLLFNAISWPTLVSVGQVFLNIALKIRFPIS